MKLSEEQRKAILAGRARVSGGLCFVDRGLDSMIIEAAQTARALRVVAVLDGLDEEQIAFCIRSADMSVAFQRRLEDANALEALARALEVLRG